MEKKKQIFILLNYICLELDLRVFYWLKIPSLFFFFFCSVLSYSNNNLQLLQPAAIRMIFRIGRDFQSVQNLNVISVQLKQRQQQKWCMLFVCHCYFKKKKKNDFLTDARNRWILSHCVHYNNQKPKKKKRWRTPLALRMFRFGGIVLFNILIWMSRFVGDIKNPGRFKWFSNETMNHHQHDDLIECKILPFHFGNSDGKSWTRIWSLIAC